MKTLWMAALAAGLITTVACEDTRYRSDSNLADRSPEEGPDKRSDVDEPTEPGDEIETPPEDLPPVEIVAGVVEQSASKLVDLLLTPNDPTIAYIDDTGQPRLLWYRDAQWVSEQGPFTQRDDEAGLPLWRAWGVATDDLGRLYSCRATASAVTSERHDSAPGGDWSLIDTAHPAPPSDCPDCGGQIVGCSVGFTNDGTVHTLAPYQWTHPRGYDQGLISHTTQRGTRTLVEGGFLTHHSSVTTHDDMAILSYALGGVMYGHYEDTTPTEAWHYAEGLEGVMGLKVASNPQGDAAIAWALSDDIGMAYLTIAPLRRTPVPTSDWIFQIRDWHESTFDLAVDSFGRPVVVYWDRHEGVLKVQTSDDEIVQLDAMHAGFLQVHAAIDAEDRLHIATFSPEEGTINYQNHLLSTP